MKKKLLNGIVLIFTLLFCCLKSSKAQELSFTYDGAGNQIERKFVCVGCTTFPLALAATLPVAQIVDAKAVTNNNAEAPRKFVAYPNPVTEVLNLRWEDDNRYYIKKIEVVASNGVMLFQQNYPYVEAREQRLTVSFLNRVPGLYVVRATYSDGKFETIKIIKK